METLWLHSAKQKKIRTAISLPIKKGSGLREFQRNLLVSDTEDVLSKFDNPNLPLVVDIGCGFGVTLLGNLFCYINVFIFLHLIHPLGLACASYKLSKGLFSQQTGCNFLGCDLSIHAISYARGLANRYNVAGICRFLFLVVSLLILNCLVIIYSNVRYLALPGEELLENLKRFYKGPVVIVLIQFPTPFRIPDLKYDFTNKPQTSKVKGNSQLPDLNSPNGGFMVTECLIKSAFDLLTNNNTRKYGIILLQSNVEDVAIKMRQLIDDLYGSHDLGLKGGEKSLRSLKWMNQNEADRYLKGLFVYLTYYK